MQLFPVTGKLPSHDPLDAMASLPFLKKCPALLVMTPIRESVYAVAYTSFSFTLVDTYNFSHFVPLLFTIPEIFHSLCVTIKIL